MKGRKYTGITKDISRRIAEHRSGKGAKFFRTSPPGRLLGYAPYPTMSEALKAEASFKRLSSKQKTLEIERLSKKTL
jgi:putative endonuclease